MRIGRYIHGMSERKYLENGTAVEVVETIAGGFLVQQIYENGEDEWMGDRKFYAERVFDEAPTEALDARFSELQIQIEKMEHRKDELQQLHRQSETDHKQILDKLSRHEQLRHLMDFIDGKITHYVTHDYWRLEIIPFTEAICGGEDSRHPNKSRLRLLSLFGDTKGNLAWNLNRYRDGSGSETMAYPVTSYEEGVRLLGQLIAASLEKPPTEYLIASANKYGIALPDSYVLAYKEGLLKSYNKELDQNTANRAIIESKISALKP